MSQSCVSINNDKRDVRSEGFFLPWVFLIKNWRWFSASKKVRWEELAAFAVCGIWFALSEFLCPFICTFVRQFWYPPARTTTITSTGIPCHRLSFLKPANPSDKPFSIFSVSLFVWRFLSPSIAISVSVYLSFVFCFSSAPKCLCFCWLPRSVLSPIAISTSSSRFCSKLMLSKDSKRPDASGFSFFFLVWKNMTILDQQ